MGIISAIVGSVYPLKGISVKLSRVGYKPLSKTTHLNGLMAIADVFPSATIPESFCHGRRFILSVAASRDVISPLSLEVCFAVLPLIGGVRGVKRFCPCCSRRSILASSLLFNFSPAIERGGLTCWQHPSLSCTPALRHFLFFKLTMTIPEAWRTSS